MTQFLNLNFKQDPFYVTVAIERCHGEGWKLRNVKLSLGKALKDGLGGTADAPESAPVGDVPQLRAAHRSRCPQYWLVSSPPQMIILAKPD